MDTIDTVRRLAGWAGWACLFFVAFATLSPIGMRPKVAEIGIEHFGAFMVVGFLFVTAYPRHAVLVVLLVIASAVLLELGQHLVPGRHGRVPDALVKIAGGALGTLAAFAINTWMTSSN